MIEIIEVKTKKEIREFVDFPTKLYKGVKQYVHPLRFDEINNFNPKKNASLDELKEAAGKNLNFQPIIPSHPITIN